MRGKEEAGISTTVYQRVECLKQELKKSNKVMAREGKQKNRKAEDTEGR